MRMRSLLFAALFAVAAPAMATLQLSANVNGTIVFCADNTACDTNPALNQMALANFTVNGVDIFGSSQFAIIGPNDAINTASFQIVNHNLTAVDVILAISQTGFLGPTASFAASGSGTWQNAVGSTINLSYYGDPANGQGADTPTDLPGLQLASFSDVAATAADAFAFNTSGPFVAGNPFSMSLGTSGHFIGWNGVAGLEPTLVGRSQTLLVSAAKIPEPATLALLGLGLVGAGVARRRK